MGNDLVLDKNYKKGSKGKKVTLIQEWLCLHNIHVAIDSDFGPATHAAVQQFQKNKGLKSDGVVGKKTFSHLIMPMTNSLKDIPRNSKTRGGMVISYAKQHLKQHPREIGGQNRGPWVRLYMKGNEGQAWAWCAGFACFVLEQACKTLDAPLPIKTSFSCDSLAASAKENGLFLKQADVENAQQITKGSLFLSRRTSTDWVHTGIVIKSDEDTFHTIEGNTNDEGSREGYEVCKRIRGYKKKDFLLI